MRLRKALYVLIQAPQLWNDNINAFLLTPGFTQLSADLNLYLRNNSILMLPCFNYIFMSYPQAAAKAAIKVQANLSEKYMITNLLSVRQCLAIKIHHDENGTRITLGQNVCITTIVRRFSMEYTHSVSIPMDTKITLDLAQDWGEMELEDITDYQIVVG